MSRIDLRDLQSSVATGPCRSPYLTAHSVMADGKRWSSRLFRLLFGVVMQHTANCYVLTLRFEQLCFFYQPRQFFD
jgi:hypothetical protein